MVGSSTGDFRMLATNTPADTSAIGCWYGTGFNSIYQAGVAQPRLYGSIDEVRFYNRALSSDEVAQLYVMPPGFCSPHGAKATAILTGDSVSGATVIDVGCGYSNTPSVRIVGGGGSGTTATANIADGIITDIVINSAGSGYTNAPKILIESPPSVPRVSIAISKVKVTQQVRINHNYILEASIDLVNWSAVGPQFTAESESIVNEFDVDLVGRYFRIHEVP